MAKKQSYVEASRVNWQSANVGYGEFPGVEKVQLGCLQRIATATEAMAIHHTNLLKECERLRISRDFWMEEARKERRKNIALKGRITRLKAKG